MTAWTLGKLAAALDATVVGDPETLIRRVVHPLQATGIDDLALILDADMVSQLRVQAPQTALVPQGLPALPIPNQLQVKRPKVALAKLLELFDTPVYCPPGVHPSAVVDSTATLGQNVSVGPLCVVGPGTVIGENSQLVAHVTVGANVTMGNDCLIHPGARIGDHVHVGSRVILQPNASIGSDGFSFVTEEAGSVESARATGAVGAKNTTILRINSIGTVVLEDDVEIGANSCVDRATLGETRIGRGTKIDNHVQVGHNVTIGENGLIAGQVGIAGSVTIGDRVVMGGQVGIKDHVHIGDDAILTAKAGIIADVPPKTIMVGVRSMPRKQFLREEMKMKRILNLDDHMVALQQRLDAFEKAHQLDATPEAKPIEDAMPCP